MFDAIQYCHITDSFTYYGADYVFCSSVGDVLSSFDDWDLMP